MYIETERLIITQFDPAMAEDVHRNSLDADNRRFVPDEVFETIDEAAETYENGDGPLVYPVLLKDKTNIGYVQAVPMDGGVWEIGYHIGGRYTGHGYATEAVRAFLPIITKKLGLDSMPGVCLAGNTASTRSWSGAVSEKFSKASEIIREKIGEFASTSTKAHKKSPIRPDG